MLRDIIGNPFRPVDLDPAWRMPPVTERATAAYEERPFPTSTLDPVPRHSPPRQPPGKGEQGAGARGLPGEGQSLRVGV